jgi:hypothetical protein
MNTFKPILLGVLIVTAFAIRCRDGHHGNLANCATCQPATIEAG